MSSSDLANLAPLLLLVVLFWFLVLRPARNRQKQFQSLQSDLVAGQRIMLSSGFHGDLVTVGDRTAEVRIAPDVVVTVERAAVVRIVTPEEPTTPEDDQ